MKSRSAAWIGLPVFALCTAGCGGRDVAPVTGLVTLDGQPLPAAQVIFEPVDGLPEETSTGETNAEGRYSLRRMDGAKGASVGLHRVKLTTLKPDLESDERTPVPRDRIPWHYRDGSLSFEVPETGTDNADFALQSR